jgi:hypothetical protein
MSRTPLRKRVCDGGNLGARLPQSSHLLQLGCNHSAVVNADWLSDETPVQSLCPRMVCTTFGLVGADVRLDWSPHTIAAITKATSQ